MSTYEDRYAISRTICAALPQESKAFMNDVDRFLTDRNALAKVVTGLTGVSKGNLQSVLRIISNATLYWGKPFECLYIYEFMNSRAAGDTEIPPMSRSTVTRAISLLVKENIIFKFVHPSENTTYYGLNLGVIFNRIREYYTTKKMVCSKNHISNNLWNSISKSPFVQSLTILMEKLAANKTIKGLNEVNKFLSDIGGRLVGNLKLCVKVASDIAKNHTEKKSQAKAQEPFFDPKTGKPNPAAAIECWNCEIRDSERFRDFYQPKTGKVIGQMKNWLLEKAEAFDGPTEQTEKKIREHIHKTIIRWDYVTDSNKEVTCTSKRGKSYEVRMTKNPEFTFYYCNRHSIDGIIDRTTKPGHDYKDNPLPSRPNWL